VGRSRAAVSNLLRLLDLHAEVKSMLETGALEMGHARALLSLESPLQAQAARRIVAEGLSVREAERLARRLLDGTTAGGEVGARPRDPNIARLEESLAERLGAKVSVRYDGRGKGSVVIRYNSLAELDGILERIK
jgi:ParB family chromosome partitioning protein